MTAIKITLTGGGGGGAVAGSTQFAGGGGAGTCIVYFNKLTPKRTLSIGVGIGGAAGSVGSYSIVSSGTQSINNNRQIIATGGMAGTSVNGGGLNGSCSLNGATGIAIAGEAGKVNSVGGTFWGTGALVYGVGGFYTGSGRSGIVLIEW